MFNFSYDWNYSNFDLYFLYEYVFICYFMIVCLAIVIILLTVSFFLSYRRQDFEKNSIYECGFEPFGRSYIFLNFRFYIISLVFLIFDLELAFLFPWISSLSLLSFFSFFSGMLFLLILSIGLFIEIRSGVLNWI